MTMDRPSGPPPPPPPPPPPSPAPPRDGSQHSDNQSNNSILSQHDDTQKIATHTTIKIRSAILPRDVIKLLITPDMTHDDFAHCISHAALSPPQLGKLLESWSMDEGESNWTRIAGLFREGDGTFIPISVILQNPENYENDVFRVSRFVQPFSLTTLKHKPQLSSKYLKYILIFGTFSAVALNMGVELNPSVIFDCIERIIDWIINLPTRIVENSINHPLRELYRHGPSVIGWEGSTLPSICTQITHMGDETFWSRNIEECEKIYLNKERAMLHVRKPIVYIIFAVVTFYAVQSLLQTWAIRKQHRPHQEMVETYEAFRLIMKVIRRGLVPSRNGVNY